MHIDDSLEVRLVGGSAGVDRIHDIRHSSASYIAQVRQKLNEEQRSLAFPPSGSRVRR